MEFSVPANTMLDGKLFQLIITLLVKKKNSYCLVKILFLSTCAV